MNTREKWEKHVDAFKVSGLSQTKYCEENGIKLSMFNYYVVKARKKSKEHGQGFVKVFEQRPVTDKEKNFISVSFTVGEGLKVRISWGL